MGNNVVVPQNNPFTGRTDGVVFAGNNYFEKDYAKCTIVQRVNHLSKEDDTAFDVVQDINITDIVDRQEYISQFEEDVGILNVLKRVVRTGDVGLIDQCKPGYIDMTNMPHDFIEAKNMYETALNAYEKIPEEVRAGLSAEEFVKMTSENLEKSLNSYVDSLVNKQPVSTETETKIEKKEEK